MKLKQDRRDFLKVSTSLGAGIALAGVSPIHATPLTRDDMPFFEVSQKRQSIRKFKSTPIPEEHMQKIINSARLAPTSGNQQPWKFVIIQAPEKISELKNECISQSIEAYISQNTRTDEEINKRRAGVEGYYNSLLSAPAYIVVLTDNESQYPSYNHHDGPLAAGYLILAATALGYGTVFTTDSVPVSVTRKVCRIPDRYTRICFIPVGIPDGETPRKNKKNLQEFIINDEF